MIVRGILLCIEKLQELIVSYELALFGFWAVWKRRIMKMDVEYIGIKNSRVEDVYGL